MGRMYDESDVNMLSMLHRVKLKLQVFRFVADFPQRKLQFEGHQLPVIKS